MADRVKRSAFYAKVLGSNPASITVIEGSRSVIFLLKVVPATTKLMKSLSLTEERPKLGGRMA